jgi:LacI family transcriptional regulator
MKPGGSKPKAPTFKDVARLAGVGLVTVSRVINDNGPISADTRKRVERALAQLDYRRNAAARSFRTGSSQIIGVVIPIMQSYSTMTRALEQSLQSAGYVMLLASSNFQPSKDAQLVELMLEKRVDGLILMPSDDTNAELHEVVRRAPVPVVMIDRDLPFFVPTVFREHYQVTRQATRMLVDLGHQRIALVAGAKVVRTARERMRGFIDELQVHGLPLHPGLLASERNSTSFGYEITLNMLRAKEPPTALIAGGDNIFVGVLRAIRELGLTVGRDISIVGSDGMEFSDVLDPPFTMFVSELDRIGEVSAEMMLAILGGNLPPAERQVTMPSRILIGESCAPPPRLKATS